MRLGSPEAEGTVGPAGSTRRKYPPPEQRFTSRRSAEADMFGCTCAPLPHLVSSELLYVTSASFLQVTSQGTECAVIAAARSQRPALFCDVRTAVSTRDFDAPFNKQRTDPAAGSLCRGRRQGVSSEQQATNHNHDGQSAPVAAALCGLPWLACSVGARQRQDVAGRTLLFSAPHRCERMMLCRRPP